MLNRIVSGGQTGADRGALDAALARGFDCGGWCPKGRRAEDGTVPGRYPLTELASARYLDRTRRNVDDSDGTLVLAHGTPTGGTRATAKHAARKDKPCLAVDLDRVAPDAAIAEACNWIREHGIAVLNVAGPRASSDPRIGDEVERIVGGLIDEMRRRAGQRAGASPAGPDF